MFGSLYLGRTRN